MNMPSLLEISAILFTTICIFLAGRNNVHTWWTGIVGCVLYGLLFYESKLYADTLLQAFFVGTGVWGWVNWKKKVAERPTTVMATDTFCLMIGGALIAAGCYGFLLHTFTDAYAPFWDSAVLALSVLAQFLLMYRKLQNWPVWVVVNIISVPLYFSKELYLSAGLYAIYLVHAIWAWRNWLNIIDGQSKPPVKDIEAAHMGIHAHPAVAASMRDNK